MKFLSSVSFWMNEHNVHTLDDFQQFIEEKKAVFSDLSAANKEIRRLETALKHIDVFEKNQPIYIQSKRGFDFMKKKYAEAHKEEIAAYVKAVKYLKANGIQAADKEKLLQDLTALQAKRTKMSNVLEQQHIDPDLIGRIQYCIKTVMETGEIPEHQKSILEQLQQPLKQQAQINEQDHREQNPTIL